MNAVLKFKNKTALLLREETRKRVLIFYKEVQGNLPRKFAKQKNNYFIMDLSISISFSDMVLISMLPPKA